MSDAPAGGTTADPGDPPPTAAPEAAITIVLVDDHEIVRAGLRLVLEAEEDFAVVAEAGDVTVGERRVASHRPDVLVLDVNMPDGSSIPAIPRIREASPNTRIVMLTMQSDPELAREALQAGATGYVLKEAARSELIQAVRLAAVGRTYLNPELGARLVARGPRSDPSARRSQRPRDRGAAPHRPRAHERRDRRPAVPQRAHRGVPPRPHSAEDPAIITRRAGRLRA